MPRIIPTDDLDVPLYGARAIGEFIDRNERETFWLLERGHLPAVKMGRKWVSTRRQLLARFESGDALRPAKFKPPQIAESTAA